MEEINWSKFDGLQRPKCQCRCGAIWRTHVKVFYKEGIKPISQDSCPQCGRRDNIRRITHDPEVFTVHG